MDNSYKDVTEEAATVKFKLTEQSAQRLALRDAPAYLLAWTTTPWTLPGNVALAVGGDIEYVAVGQGGAGSRRCHARPAQRGSGLPLERCLSGPRIHLREITHVVERGRVAEQRAA